MAKSVGKCFFCQCEVFNDDLRRDRPKVVQFPLQGAMRYGCLSHPGVEDVFRGKLPAPPSLRNKKGKKEK